MDDRVLPAQNRGMDPAALLLSLLVAASTLHPAGDVAAAPAAAWDSLRKDDLEQDLALLASPALEGRDSPSPGLLKAAEHIAARLQAAGLRPVKPEGGYLQYFERILPAPVEKQCSLAVSGGTTADPPPAFELGRDFVPVWRTSGSASGELVLLAFGIDSKNESYDDVTGDLRGRIVVIVEGEPHHKKRFEGPEVTAEADLYAKLGVLAEAGVAGVLVTRRIPAEGGAALSFRHTWAFWNGGSPVDPPPVPLPVLEITPAAATALTGEDVLARAAAVDASAKAPKPIVTGRTVEMSAATSDQGVNIPNVVALLDGSDADLAGEYLVLGAHFDHVGVDPRGRIGYGADDNASGTAALLEIAEALALARPRRSILVCAFSAEEDGLVGSNSFCRYPPVPVTQMVAMLNMDMIGRGEVKEVAVLGVNQNPGFEKLLKTAQKLRPTGVKEVVTGQGLELFARSDHYSFHQVGVPVLFFFEGLPIDKNADYHTWRDTLEEIDLDKVLATSRLVFNTAWLLANADERPPAPGR